MVITQMAYCQSALSDSLYALGVELYNVGKYKEAIPFFEECDKLDKVEFDSLQEKRYYGDWWLASCYYKLGKEKKAIEISPKYYYFPPTDRRLMAERDSVEEIAIKYLKETSFSFAAMYIKDVMKIEKELCGEMSLDYLGSYFNLAYCNLMNGSTLSALDYLGKAKKIQDVICKEKSPLWIDYYTLLVLCHFQQGDTITAMKMADECINRIGPENKENYYEYAHFLIEIVKQLNNLGKCDDAIEYGEKALRIMRKYKPAPKEECAISGILINSYMCKGDRNKAKSLLDSIYLLIKSSNSANDDSTIELLHLLLKGYASIEEKELLQTTIEDIQKRVSDKYTENSIEMANCQWNIAQSLMSVGEYNLTFDAYLKARKIYKDLGQEKTNSYIELLNACIQFYGSKYDYDNTIATIDEELDILKEMEMTHTNYYTFALSSKISIYKTKGNNEKVLSITKELGQSIIRVNGENSSYYVNFLISGLAPAYYSCAQIDSSLIVLSDAERRIDASMLIPNNLKVGIYMNRATIDSEWNHNVVSALQNIEEAKKMMLSTVKDENNPTYIEFLNAYSTICVNCNKWEMAIENYKKIISFCESHKDQNGTKNTIYVSALQNISQCYIQTAKIDEATSFAQKAVDIMRELAKGDDINLAASLGYLSNSYIQQGNYEKALDLAIEQKEMMTRLLGENDYRISGTLLNIGQIKCLMGNPQEGLSYLEKSVAIADASNSRNITPLVRLMECYGQLGDFEEYERTLKKAFEIVYPHKDQSPDLYAALLYYQANLKIQQSEYTSALDYASQAMEIIEGNLDVHSVAYLNMAMAKVNCVKTEGFNDKAYELLIEAKKIADEMWPDTMTFNKAIILGTMANHLIDLGKGKEAQQYAEQIQEFFTTDKMRTTGAAIDTKEILAKTFFTNSAFNDALTLEQEVIDSRSLLLGENNAGNVSSYVVLGNIYNAFDEKQKAYESYEKSVELAIKLYGDKHPNTAMMLNNLALAYSDAGDYNKALETCLSAYEIYKNKYGENSPMLVPTLSRISEISLSLGDAENADKSISKAIELCIQKFGEDNYIHAQLLVTKAKCQSGLRNFDKAIEIAKKAVTQLTMIYGNDNSLVASAKCLTANFYDFRGDIDSTYYYAKAAYETISNIYGNESSQRGEALRIMINCEIKRGNTSEASNMTDNLIELYKKVYGEKHPAYLISITYKMYIDVIKEEYEDVCSDVSMVSELSKDMVLRNISKMTSSMRMKYWNNISSLYSDIFPQIALNINDGDVPGRKYEQLLKDTYNSLLLGKGLLLNADVEFSYLISQCNDELISSKYQKLLAAKSMVNKLYSLPISERLINADSLSIEVAREEKILIDLLQKHGDYTDRLSTSWEEVKKNLKQNDIAIEFVKARNKDNKDIYYALFLASDYTSPQKMILFEENVLNNITDTEQYYTTDTLYNLVWKPLESILNGKNNVYFSPIGKLYNIAIEYVPGIETIRDNTGKPTSFYRVSSTREIVYKNKNNRNKSAAIYGGIKYDTSVASLVADNKKYPQKRTFGYEQNEISDSLNVRSGVYELPATKIEAEKIENSLQKLKYKTELFIDTIGTEASFKDLSSRNIRLVHIATHGFYWTEQEAKYRTYLSFISLDDTQNGLTEDKALTRSGLLFAGANNALTGKKIPKNVDDGVLTAKEISQLDLRGLDLVVLSACQTGLGEITSDGVFGLQRGFKKAGASSLIMSLWKVDDNATQLLMTQFYKNMSSGQNKYEALRSAQAYVRDYEVQIESYSESNSTDAAHGKKLPRHNEDKSKETKTTKKYKDPKYWAAFILLDAIN